MLYYIPTRLVSSVEGTVSFLQTELEMFMEQMDKFKNTPTHTALMWLNLNF